MAYSIKADECLNCGACEGECPNEAISEKDVPFIKSHADRLIHFHIHDGSENPPKNHLALGDGEINLNNRLQLAKSRNARCVLETKTIAALEKSVEYLKLKNIF